MNVHPKLNLNAPTFYVDGTEQTQIQDVDIAPASDAEDWKVEEIPALYYNNYTDEWSFLLRVSASGCWEEWQRMNRMEGEWRLA